MPRVPHLLNDPLLWVLALLVSLAVGDIACRLVHLWLRGKKEETGSVPGWFTGLTERPLFTIAVAYWVPGVMTAMMAWIGAKMAANWMRRKAPDSQPEELDDIVKGQLSALLAGAVSMFFALLGGLILQGRFP